MPTVEKHRQLLEWHADPFGIAERGQLPPAGDLALMQRELSGALARKTPDREAVQLVMVLLAGYAQRPAGDAGAYAESLAQALADFPPDIALAAVLEVRDEVKFLPSFAELKTACRSRADRLHAMLRKVEAMEREAARLERERLEEEERQRVKQEEIEKQHARLVEHSPPGSVRQGDHERAEDWISRHSPNDSFSLYIAWRAALGCCLPWAITATRRASILAQAMALRGQPFDFDDLLRVIELLATDEAAARAAVENPEHIERDCDAPRPASSLRELARLVLLPAACDPSLGDLAPDIAAPMPGPFAATIREAVRGSIRPREVDRAAKSAAIKRVMMETATFRPLPSEDDPEVQKWLASEARANAAE